MGDRIDLFLRPARQMPRLSLVLALLCAVAVALVAAKVPQALDTLASELSVASSSTDCKNFGDDQVDYCEWSCVTCTNRKVTAIDLSGQSLTGTIASVDFTTLPDLKTFSIEANRISGTIPPSLGALTQLTSVSLDGNLLSGSVPMSFASLSTCLLNQDSSATPFFCPTPGGNCVYSAPCEDKKNSTSTSSTSGSSTSATSSSSSASTSGKTTGSHNTTSTSGSTTGGGNSTTSGGNATS